MTPTEEREAIANLLRRSAEKFRPNERAKVSDVFLAMEIAIRRGDHLSTPKE